MATPLRTPANARRTIAAFGRAPRLHPRRRSARAIRRLGFVAGVVALSGLLAPAIGHADPHPSLSEVRAQVHHLELHAERVTERFDAATMKAEQAQRKAHVAQAKLGRQKAKVAAQGERVAAVAAALYRAGPAGSSFLQVMLNGGPAQFVERAATANIISQQQTDALHDYRVAEHRVHRARNAAQDAARKATARRAAAKKRKTKVESLLSKRKQLLSQLTAEQQARLKRQRAAQSVAARAQRGSFHPTAVSGSSSSAVGFAGAQLGKPYAWGAAGPSAYDCSGLTMAAWRAAGVSLPHNAAAQYAATSHISMSQLQPGDLVFRGSPAYHVGIYIGGGRVIDAPHTGASVHIGGLGYYQYASRP